MNQRIIYKTDEGEVAVIIPTAEALTEHTIEEIAQKDVPSGKAYKIVSVDDFQQTAHFEVLGKLMKLH